MSNNNDLLFSEQLRKKSFHDGLSVEVKNDSVSFQENGFEFLKVLRENTEKKNLEIIGQTTVYNDEFVNFCKGNINNFSNLFLYKETNDIKKSKHLCLVIEIGDYLSKKRMFVGINTESKNIVISELGKEEYIYNIHSEQFIKKYTGHNKYYFEENTNNSNFSIQYGCVFTDTFFDSKNKELFLYINNVMIKKMDYFSLLINKHYILSKDPNIEFVDITINSFNGDYTMAILSKQKDKDAILEIHSEKQSKNIYNNSINKKDNIFFAFYDKNTKNEFHNSKTGFFVTNNILGNGNVGDMFSRNKGMISEMKFISFNEDVNDYIVQKLVKKHDIMLDESITDENILTFVPNLEEILGKNKKYKDFKILYLNSNGRFPRDFEIYVYLEKELGEKGVYYFDIDLGTIKEFKKYSLNKEKEYEFQLKSFVNKHKDVLFYFNVFEKYQGKNAKESFILTKTLLRVNKSFLQKGVQGNSFLDKYSLEQNNFLGNRNKNSNIFGIIYKRLEYNYGMYFLTRENELKNIEFIDGFEESIKRVGQLPILNSLQEFKKFGSVMSMIAGKKLSFGENFQFNRYSNETGDGKKLDFSHMYFEYKLPYIINGKILLYSNVGNKNDNILFLDDGIYNNIKQKLLPKLIEEKKKGNIEYTIEENHFTFQNQAMTLIHVISGEKNSFFSKKIIYNWIEIFGK